MATVAELLSEIGRAKASGILGAGQAWGNALQQLGQIPGQTIGQIRQGTEQAQQAKLRDLQTQEAQLGINEASRNVDARTALGQIVTSTPHVDEDGVSLYDISAISKKLEDVGFGDHVGDVATSLKGINDAFRTERTAKLALVQRGAQSLLQANSDPDLTLHFIDTLEKNGSYAKADLDQFRAIIRKDPAKTPAILRYFAGPEKLGTAAPGSTIYGETSGATVATVPDKPEKPTEASLAYDLTSTDAAVRARASAAMDALKGAKPGTPEDWVSRSRRLAVTKNGGQPLTDEQLMQVDGAALKEFKETNADPELRAAALAQKNLALAMAQMQQSQQPTPEQAADVAKDIVAHRLAPEQLTSMFGGFGPSGQAFKRMVYTEAKKLDPEFNFEQASAEYVLAKSPAFQNTVRYMDAVIESIPRLEETAKRIGNGRFRTLNDLVNATRQQFNSADIKAFKTDALLVGDEVAKILQGGGTGAGTSDAKLKQASEIISTSDDVPAIAAAVNEIKFLIGNRRKALTRGTYMENAAPPGTIRAKDPQGNIHEAPAGTPLPAGWVAQ